MMSNIDDIGTQEEFDTILNNQWTELFDEMEKASAGSDELSALVKACLLGCLLERIDKKVGPLMESWLLLRKLKIDPNTFAFVMRAIHTPLYPPYTTSMDAMVPGENIVMLSKQHRPPGVAGERWAALQDKAKVSYMGNTAILACRVNGLRNIRSNV